MLVTYLPFLVFALKRSDVFSLFSGVLRRRAREKRKEKKKERVTRDEAHSDAYVNSVNGLRVTIISYQKASGEYLVEAPNGATAFTRAKYLKVDDPSVVL